MCFLDDVRTFRCRQKRCFFLFPPFFQVMMEGVFFARKEKYVARYTMIITVCSVETEKKIQELKKPRHTSNFLVPLFNS